MPSFLRSGARPDPSQLAPIQNQADFRVKPEGGLWTTRETESGHSSWLAWCAEEQFNHHSTDSKHGLWRLGLPEEPRLYRIDSLADLALAHDRFPCDRRYSSRYTDHGLDYEAMARCYDGIELTDHGQADTRHSRPLDLYGWDVASALFFRWLPFSIEEVA